MKQTRWKFSILIFSVIVVTSLVLLPSTSAQSVPEWIKNTALWYGEGNISETEFLNAIKFLIENEVITIEKEKAEPKSAEPTTSNIIIPNGNANIEHTGFYIPLNLEVTRGSIVIWVNDDTVPHTVQSIDQEDNIIGMFNSAPLSTGERFAHTFEDEGTYHYYCSLHPWRVGQVTVR